MSAPKFRRAKDLLVSIVVRGTSALVLLAVAGMFVQMVLVAWPLTGKVNVVPVETSPHPANNLPDRPLWVPDDLAKAVWLESSRGRVWAGIDGSGAIRLARAVRDSDPDKWLTRQLPLMEFEAAVLFIDNAQRWLVVVTSDGAYRIASLSGAAVQWVADGRIAPFEHHAVGGGGHTLVFTEGREVRQVQLLATDSSPPSLEILRRWQTQRSISALATAPNSQRLLFLTTEPALELWNATTQRHVLSKTIAEQITSVGWLDQEHFFADVDSSGTKKIWRIVGDNDSISLRSLFTAQHYVGYPDSAHVWQTSSVGDGHEQKFGLVPLLFGSLKAASIAMLLALPCAIGAAFFVGFFMSYRARNRVKPVVELLEAFPTVVLAAIAAVWLAPQFLEALPEICAALICLITGVFLTAGLWRWAPAKLHGSRYHSSMPLLLIPLLLVFIAIGAAAGGYIEDKWLSGSIAIWLNQNWNYELSHLNGLLVGVAMGVAVIPGIFSLAEDAVYSVPRFAAEGSLALGASRWRSFRDVVLPLAWPGVISAIAIGLGRALGETMIVLMISGNTPILDWNPFNGMRTVSATLAIELPETALNSVHYQILFFAALILFLITFVFNTLAELLRLRMRSRYRQLAS